MMIFRKPRLDRRILPIGNITSSGEPLPRRRLVTCWRPNGSGQFVIYWKVIGKPRGEPPS
jgi:hypothetical protein